MSKPLAHYVLSTHWDREWHTPFQTFRHELVGLLDRVLQGLTDGRLKGPFCTDGHAVLVEDYLEMRPERRELVEDLARRGLLVIGPWYVLPDEFLVSGESLIRNLRQGRDVARALGGEPSGAGFVCDMLGHNSQLPQIFAGFGIHGGFIWRGVNTGGKRNLIWRGADGTELVCHRFGVEGYGSYAERVRRNADFEAGFEPSRFDEYLDDYITHLAANSDVEALLLFDGCDHQVWDEPVYAMLAERMARGGGSHRIVHTSLDQYVAAMLGERERITTIVEGELREPGLDQPGLEMQCLLSGTLSSRVWIKQANSACQALLCYWAEPVCALARAMLGETVPGPAPFLDLAWRWLLKNQAHDSICGCSVDQVHEDMKFRFSQAQQIGDRLTEDATRAIAASVAGDLGENEMRVVVFNPLTGDVVEQPVELTLQIPAEWPGSDGAAFRLTTADGAEVGYQRLEQAPDQTRLRRRPTTYPQIYKTNDVRIALPLSVPAAGYSTLTVRPADQAAEAPPLQDAPGMATGDRAMANDILDLEIQPDGTVTLTDRRTSHVYPGLLAFEDSEDIGDGWNYTAAENGRVFVSTAGRTDVELVHDGPMLTVFRIHTVMAVPEAFDFEGQARSARSIEMRTDSLLSLRPGQDYVDVRTVVDNTARDHRLRVLAPSGTDAATYLADSPFDVIERDIALRADNDRYRERETETKPQQSWTAVYEGDRGVAVLSEGLFESAVRDLPGRPIALTLFRGTHRTAVIPCDTGGQCLGTMAFRYRIMPLTGRPDPVRLCRLGQQMMTGLRTVQLKAEDLAIHRTATTVPPTAGLLRVDGPAVATSLRQVDHGLELRMFNPLGSAVTVCVGSARLAAPAAAPRTVYPVDFESNPLAPARPLESVCEVPLKAKQIVTLRLE